MSEAADTPHTLKRRKPKKKTKVIARYGTHGQTVRVWEVVGTDKVMLQYRINGERKTESFRGPNARELARAQASLRAGGVVPDDSSPVTIRDLWSAYETSRPFRKLRPRSKQLYRDAWRLFSRFVPSDTAANKVDAKLLGSVEEALRSADSKRERPYAVKTVQSTLNTIKSVFAWAEREEILPVNRVRAYKFTAGKDEITESPDEYTQEEFGRLREAMNIRDPRQRRAYVILSVLGLQGPRVGAVLRLSWTDIDWKLGTITWRARYDKLGREWHQHMRRPTRAVLLRYWRACGRPTRGWLFPSDHPTNQEEVYSYQSFLDALRLAERRAGVEYRPYRGPHGFRRMVAGDVAERSGSAWKAMQVIGDKDVRQAEKYLKRRKAVTAKSLDLLDEDPRPAPPLDEPIQQSSSSPSSS